MQNRSTAQFPPLPVIYKPVEPQYPTHKKCDDMFPLNVYDVTYLHFHNLMEIALCVSGTGTCYVEGREFPFSAGDIQIIFPYQRHLSKSSGSEPSRWYWLNVDPSELLSGAGFADAAGLEEMLHNDMGVFGIVDRERYPDICRMARRLIMEVMQPDPSRLFARDYYAACFFMLLMELRQTAGQQPALPRRHGDSLSQIAPALLEIKQAVDEGRIPGVSELCGLCSMSQATFRRKFSAAVGTSPKDYITACCVRRACRLLLDSDEKIIQIAALCGFSDVSGFNRCFLKHMGVSPSRYRRQG